MLSDYQVRRQVQKNKELGEWKATTKQKFQERMLKAYQIWKVHEHRTRNADGSQVHLYIVSEDEMTMVNIGLIKSHHCESDKYELWTQ